MAVLTKLIGSASAVVLAMQLAVAAESPQEQRHEMMEDVGGGAKTIGKMLEGENPFDAAAAMAALQTWAAAADEFGELFPEGSESGYDTEAKATIWSDREGFDAALQAWADAVDAAIAANPQDLESLQAAAGPVFKKCKACHQDYRVEKE
jgi:cytochrome c556